MNMEALRGLCFPKLDTKFTTKQQRLAKIGTINDFGSRSKTKRLFPRAHALVQ